MKKRILLLGIVFCLILISIFVIFNIEIKKDNKIIYYSFTEDFGRFDEVTCYDDGISYDKKLDISVTSIDITKILFFYKITLEYESGNLCDYEYVLEESYIKEFIDNAKIIENPKNIDIAKLIEDKEAIVDNIRYSSNDYETSISYVLNDRDETLYVFYVDDLLVIQVGLSDEGPKFIAYK